MTSSFTKLRNFILILLLIPVYAYDADVKDKLEFGGILGWGSPLGFGVEGGIFNTPHTAITGGLGFSMSGLKLGIGAKYLLSPEKMITPLAGVYLSRSSGLSNLNVSVNQDAAVYRIDPALLLTLRSGLRFQSGFITLSGHVGYGFVLSGGGSEYLSGSDSEDVSRFAGFMEPGGIEISVGAGLRLPI